MEHGQLRSHGSGIRGILQDPGDPIERGRPPHRLTEPIALRHAKVPAGEASHQLADRALLQEAGEDQGDPIVHLTVGILDHAAAGVTYQAGGQSQRQL